MRSSNQRASDAYNGFKPGPDSSSHAKRRHAQPLDVRRIKNLDRSAYPIR
jgi:capsule polysaccharide export protein KpsC/LpsZ